MSLIKKPTDMQINALVKAFIYGQPGLGKTTLGLSAPQPLLLDFDGGAQRVDPQYWGDTVPVSSWKDVLDVLEDPSLSEYKTFVIDTAGKMLDFMNVEVGSKNTAYIQRDGSLTQKGYGARKVMFKNFLAQITMMGRHVVFIAHEEEVKKGDDYRVRPEVGGSSGSDLIKEMDLVGYMQADGNKRTVSFSPTNVHYAKNSCQLDPLIHIPVLTGQPNTFLCDVFEKIKSNQELKKEIANKYVELTKEIVEVSESIEDAETANTFVKWVKDVEHIWDSNLFARKIMLKKTKELNLIFNKDRGAFEEKPDAPVETALPVEEEKKVA